jgi:hypothetical protein
MAGIASACLSSSRSTAQIRSVIMEALSRSDPYRWIGWGRPIHTVGSGRAGRSKADFRQVTADKKTTKYVSDMCAPRFTLGPFVRLHIGLARDRPYFLHARKTRSGLRCGMRFFLAIRGLIRDWLIVRAMLDRTLGVVLSILDHVYHQRFRSLGTHIHPCIHLYTHVYVHTCVHMYIHTMYIYAWKLQAVLLSVVWPWGENLAFEHTVNCIVFTLCGDLREDKSDVK